MRKIISTIAAGMMAASGLALIAGGVAQATQHDNDDKSCRHYSWVGGPLEEGQIPPRAPGEGWQANTTQEPHGDRATWVDGKPGLHFTGEPGRANWFDYVCDKPPQPCPTATVTVPGPTVTATERVEVPGPTVTATVTAPGATATVTATATATATEPGPTVTATVTVPGPTVTAPGPVVTVTERATETVTATATETVTATATETEYAATSSTQRSGLAKTGANLGTLGLASLLIAGGTVLWAFATRRRGAHE
jgi:hypothetical protein